ncbi:MAG: PEP-CTERM sorting domain-containing protein [Pirellulales bacterium]|nr:PEP-CTERM sorting domain-containing protein [Pirellulales bacterium]
MIRLFSMILGIAAVLVMASPAQAVIFVSSSGSLSASADFSIVGGNLQVILTNTSTSDVLVPSEVLTAVFFDWPPSNPSLTRISAVLNAGSSVLFGTTDPGGVVGGEWAFKSGLSGAPGGSALGVSSAGFGLFAPSDVFPGTNLQGPAEPDGVQYGITSAGDNPATGNTPVTGSNALIKNSVVFTLGGLPAGADVSTLTNVQFQYGTALDETIVPEPLSVIVWTLLGASWAGLAVMRRRSVLPSRQPWSADARKAILDMVENKRI